MVTKKKPQKKTAKKEVKVSKITKVKKKKALIPEVLSPLTGLTGSPPKNLPAIFDATTMDSTSTIEISFMHNDNYAPEIISKIIQPEHVKNLLAMKNSGDVSGFMKNGKEHIIDICRGIDSLKVHG